MKNIRIESIKITNFKGIRNLEIEAKANNIEIFGANGTGKTTVSDAINWALFGKDSLGRANFAIKTIDKKTGKEIEKLPHEVELLLNVDNSPIKLTRCLNEIWNKKNEFKGNTTQYLVNDVELKESEYKEYINELVDETIFLAITNPRYFANLPWQSQREMLFRMANLQSDEDIMSENPEFAKLAAYRMGIDQIKSSVSTRKAKQVKELNETKIRIDEKERDLSKLEAPEFNIETIYEAIEDRQAQIRDIDASSKDAASLLLQLNKDKKAISDKIFNLEQEKRQMKIEDESSVRASMEDIKDDIYKKKLQIRDYEQGKRDREESAISLENRISRNDESIKALRNEWNEIAKKKAEVDESKFTPEQTYCPYCSKPYTDNEFKSMESSFNSHKADKIEKLNERFAPIERKADDINLIIASDKKDLIEVTKELKSLINDLGDLRGELGKLEDDLKTAQSTPVEYRSTSHLDKEIEELKDKLNSFSSQCAADNLSERRREIEAEIKELASMVNTHNRIDENNKRIKELQEKQSALTEEIAKLEEIEELIKEFVAFKINSSESSINSMFEIVKFKLYNYLIDGTPKETCEAMVDNTPYGTLNNAMQVNAGIDIINALSRYYNISAPITVDNKESVTHLQYTNAQIIALTVDPFEPQLKVK